MDKLVLTILGLLIPLYATAGECTEFLSQLYSGTYNAEIEITADKNETVDKYEDYVNNQYVASVIYGKGYFKQQGKRKQKIMYMCTMKDFQTPSWGYVLPR